MRRRRRSTVDGKLRYPCPSECGRLVATDEDWNDDDISEGERDDLCWGFGANCQLKWPVPASRLPERNGE